MSGAQDDGFGLGDFVEHKANTNVFGVVIGFEGSLILVRLAPSLVIAKFHEYELQPMDPDEYEPDAENVIDFTKERALRANTKTEGVA